MRSMLGTKVLFVKISCVPRTQERPETSLGLELFSEMSAVMAGEVRSDV